MKKYLMSATLVCLVSISTVADAGRFLNPNSYHGSRYQTNKVKADIHRYNLELYRNAHNRDSRVEFEDARDFNAFLALARAANKRTITHVMRDTCHHGKCNYSHMHQEYNRRITAGEGR